MEDIESFGEVESVINPGVLKLSGVSDFINNCSESMMQMFITETKDYGVSDERNRIIYANFISPVMQLCNLGWKDDEILELQGYQLRLAADVCYDREEFSRLCTELAITEDTPEYDALRMLREKKDLFACELEESYPEYKKFVDIMSPSVKSDIIMVKMFFQRFYKSNPEVWYLKMLTGVDLRILNRVKKFYGDSLLILALLPILEKKLCRIPYTYEYKTNKELFWVHLDWLEIPKVLPIYQWQDIWREFDSIEGDIGVSFSATDVFVYKQYSTRSIYGAVQLDVEDPVVEVVDKALTNIKIEADKFTDEEKYTFIFFIVKEILSGNKDWYLYLKYPQYFKSLYGFNKHQSLRDLIMLCIPNENKQYLTDVCTGLVQIDGKIVSTYLAYADGSIEEAIKEGKTIYVGTNKEKEITFHDYVSDFADWVQAAS